jgi:uncharacterized protein YgiB involved in biofilm formation
MDADRRRSLIVNLTLVGVAGAFVFGPMLPEGKEVRHNEYNSLSDCARDYSPAQCAPSSSGGGSGGGYWWRGPTYFANRTLPEAQADPGPGRAGLAVRTESSMRGGFGRVGRFLRVAG